MLKYSVIALFISLLLSLSYAYKNLNHSIYEKKEILLFERRGDSLYFETIAETMFSPSLVELKRAQGKFVEIVIKKKPLHSPITIKDTDLKSSDDFVQLRVTHTKNGLGFSVKIPTDFKALNFHLK